LESPAAGAAYCWGSDDQGQPETALLGVPGLWRVRQRHSPPIPRRSCPV